MRGLLNGLRLSLVLLSLCHASPCLAEEAPADGGPIKVLGETVEYFHEEEKVVASGNVSIDYEGAKLSADRMTVYMASKTAIAEGNVVLVQKGSTFRGERGEYNFGTKTGKVDAMRAEVEPSLYGRANQIDRVSLDHYRGRDMYLTTCKGDRPFWKVQAQEVDIFPGQKVIVRNAVLFINNIPVLFIPVYVQPLVNFDRFPVQIVPGKNSEWGPFILSKWRYELADTPALHSKGNLLLDYRVKRGVGVGVENFYRGEKVGRGAATVYYVDDHDAPGGENLGRYRGRIRHQMPLGEATTFTAEANKLSDPEIIKDFFFHEEYERDVFPDNYVSVITSKPEYSLSILDRERIDDFYTVVERSPEVRFDTHTRRFAKTPFYLRQEYQFANLKKEFSRSEYQYDALRFDINQTLYYDAQVGPVSVTPRVGTRQTYLSRRVDDDEDVTRGTFDPGLDLSVRFFKTYDVRTRALGLDVNGLRHIFTPTASYNFRHNPTAPRTILQQFDQLDTLDKRHFIRFNFENKLQTKEHDGNGNLFTREFARVIPFFDMDYDSHRLENIGFDAELRPYSWLGIETDATYDNRIDRFETANIDVFFTKGNVTFGLGHRYLREESAQTTVEARVKFNEQWAARVYERFEFQDDDSEEFEVTLSRTFDCVIVDFTYNHREGDTFFFVFRLKGYPKASFGLSQSYNRPKASPVPSQI